jgi:hypothetical protein
MKTTKYIFLSLICLTLCSCVTSYDRYGRSIQTIDPVAGTVGAVAIGALAYNAGQNNSYYNNRCYDRQPSFYTTGRRFYHYPRVYNVRGNTHIYKNYYRTPSCRSSYRR